jgi:ketosteroid isomerase-like protein
MAKVPCVFVMRVRDGRIIESRDYIDPIRTYTARGDLDRLIASLRKGGS